MVQTVCVPRALVQAAHARSQGSHRVGEATVDRIIGVIRGGFLRRDLFPKCEQFSNCHRANRPIQFHQQSITITAAELVLVDGLLQSTELHFDAPTHFVEANDLFLGQLTTIQHTGQHPHVRLADPDLD